MEGGERKNVKGKREWEMQFRMESKHKRKLKARLEGKFWGKCKISEMKWKRKKKKMKLKMKIPGKWIFEKEKLNSIDIESWGKKINKSEIKRKVNMWYIEKCQTEFDMKSEKNEFNEMKGGKKIDN